MHERFVPDAAKFRSARPDAFYTDPLYPNVEVIMAATEAPGFSDQSIPETTEEAIVPSTEVEGTF
jgi:hypothetical protein